MTEEKPLSEKELPVRNLNDEGYLRTIDVAHAVERLKEAVKKNFNQASRGHTRSNLYFNLKKDIDEIFGDLK